MKATIPRSIAITLLGKPTGTWSSPEEHREGAFLITACPRLLLANLHTDGLVCSAEEMMFMGLCLFAEDTLQVPLSFLSQLLHYRLSTVSLFLWG